MFVLLRICTLLPFALFVPAVAHAAVLDTPHNGSSYSGIGVIYGWKCSANGPLTVRFNGGNPLSLAYGNERGDTVGNCGDTNNGFVSIMNWANLGDGTHTAVVYDNGREFARSTFTVTTLGDEYVRGASGECTISDFPSSGETATFEWDQSTQGLVLSEWDGGGSNGGGNGGDSSDSCPTDESYDCRNKPAEASSDCITLKFEPGLYPAKFVNSCDRPITILDWCEDEESEGLRPGRVTKDGYQLYEDMWFASGWYVEPYGETYNTHATDYQTGGQVRCSGGGEFRWASCFCNPDDWIEEVGTCTSPSPKFVDPNTLGYICLNMN